MLVIRCERCQTVVWFTRDRSAFVTCSHCDQQYGLPKKIRDRTMDEIHRQAYGLAIELKVDFPSATSMVFGILKLPQVKEFLVEPEEDEPREEAARPALEEPGWSSSFDEAFRPAVEAGRLTPRDALHRGRRESYAQQIVDRHGISLKDAYRVADNEETLLSVLRSRKPVAPRRLMKPRRIQLAALFALGLVAVALLTIWRVNSGIRKDVELAQVREAERVEREQATRESFDLPATMEMTAAKLTELHHDSTGRLTRITAPSPEAVLQAYCGRNRRHPLSLASGMLPDENLWLGLYADTRRPDRTQGIAIRRSGTGRHWFAGSGRDEIEVLKLDPMRLGKLRKLPSRPLELNVVEVW